MEIKQLKEKIGDTKLQLLELIETIVDLEAAIDRKDEDKIRAAFDGVEEHTDKYWFKLIVDRDFGLEDCLEVIK